MASREAIGIIETDALKRIEQAVEVVGEKLGVDAPVYERPTKDPAYNSAVRLRAIAMWLENVVSALTPQPNEKDMLRERLASMGKDEVIDLAAKAGLAVTSKTTKTDAVEYLVATHVGGANAENSREEG